MAFPWDFHPDLTADRLVAVARLIATARDAVVSRHEPQIGDDDWVLGCRAFQSCRYAIAQFAQIEEVLWLGILDPSRHFVFRIGSIPVRFYKGDPEDQGHRVKNQSFPELAQLNLVFGDEDQREVLTRIAVETDSDGGALAIHCVGSKGEDIVFNWSIPFHAEVEETQTEHAADVVELPPPIVGELDEVEAENDNREATLSDAAND